MDCLAEHPRYKEARRRARSLRGFYVHALAYIVVMTSVFALGMAGAPIRHWPGWPLFWGLGLLAHGFAVLVAPGLFGADWEERKIREYLERRP
jgi:2TM domain-containing protein